MTTYGTTSDDKVIILTIFCFQCHVCVLQPVQVQQCPMRTHRGGWGCEVSCGGHHRSKGKTTTGSALDGAVFDIAQILAYLVHNMSRSQLYLGHFGWLPSLVYLGHLADSLLFSVNNILAGLWLNCISSVEITLFLLADILLQQRALFQW